MRTYTQAEKNILLMEVNPHHSACFNEYLIERNITVYSFENVLDFINIYFSQPERYIDEVLKVLSNVKENWTQQQTDAFFENIF